MSARIGKQYGDYVVQELLGVGGMGEVFRATQISLDRPVALKFITAERYADDVNRRRFLREIRACSTLQHPNIVKIYDSGEEEGDIYLVMEYLEGKPLEAWIRAQPDGLPADFVLKVCEDVLESLVAMHPKGFIHRDIKPANIMIGKFNRAVLMDFGLVKIAQDTRLTQTGRVLGTPRYLAPESLASQSGDHRADIYQVGLVMCEALLGKIPFKQRELMEYVKGEREQRPKTPREARPDLPEGIQLLMQNALEVQPEARYQEAREMLADLARVRDGKPIQATRDVKQVGFPRVFPELRLSSTFLERYVFQSFVTRDPLVSVVQAHDKKRARDVQLRFLSPTLVGSCPHPEALVAALQSLTRLEHPNVFSPTAMGREEGVYYLSYPVSADPTLKESLEARDRFERDVVVRAGQQITAGLAAMHAAGLVHGFLTPTSLIIAPTGTISVTDAELGLLARHTAFADTKESTTRITYYSPPELLDGEAPTEASDLFALAALLYRMLTGDYHVASASLAEDRNDPVRSLLVAAMDSDPQRRGSDVAQFGAELVKRAGGTPNSRQRLASAPERPLAEALVPPLVRRPTGGAVRDMSVLDSSVPPRRPPHPAFLRALGGLVAVSIGIATWLAFGSRIEVGDVHALAETSSATLQWTTSRPVETRVELGTDAENMEVVEDPGHARTTRHKVVTPNLKSGTSYVFRVLLPHHHRSPDYTFTTPVFELGVPSVLFRGMRATVSWTSTLRATSYVLWSGPGSPQPERRVASASPAQRHTALLEGPLMLWDSTVVAAVRAESGDELKSPPVPVPGVAARATEMATTLDRLEVPTLLRHLVGLSSAPAAEAARVRARLEALTGAKAAKLAEVREALPALLDAPRVPAPVKADLYRIATLLGHLEAACDLAGLPSPVTASELTGSLFAMGDQSRMDPTQVLQATIPEADRGFIPAEPGGSRMGIVGPVRSQQLIKLTLASGDIPAIAELELSWDSLPPGRYLTVELPGHAELVFRNPPGSPNGPRTMFHGFDPALLGVNREVPLIIRALALEGAPANPGKTIIKKLALRYRSSVER